MLVHKNLDLSTQVNALGMHVIVDYYECSLDTLCKTNAELSGIEEAVREKLEDSGVVVLAVHSHFFAPHAISVSFHLAESHLHFHTWPEKGYVSFDFFCCSQFPDLEQRMIEISNFCGTVFFKNKKAQRHVIQRGMVEI